MHLCLQVYNIDFESTIPSMVWDNCPIAIFACDYPVYPKAYVENLLLSHFMFLRSLPQHIYAKGCELSDSIYFYSTTTHDTFFFLSVFGIQDIE